MNMVVTGGSVLTFRGRTIRSCNQCSLLFNGYRWAKLTTDLHLVPKLRKSGAIPLVHRIISWRGVEKPYFFLFSNSDLGL